MLRKEYPSKRVFKKLKKVVTYTSRVIQFYIITDKLEEEQREIWRNVLLPNMGNCLVLKARSDSHQGNGKGYGAKRGVKAFFRCCRQGELGSFLRICFYF